MNAYGVSGVSTTVYDAMFGDILEQVPELLWPNSMLVYARMRTDPQLQAVLKAYSLPIRRATWSVNGDGVDPKITRVVADQLGLAVKGDDAPALRRAAVRWADFVRLAMLHLEFGHMPFEKVYDTSDGRTAQLSLLLERMPQTLSDIRVDFATNQIVEIRQLPYVTTKASPVIPANRLVWFDHDREGAAYQGKSMLRPAYGPWLLKHEMWRVHATSIRRFGMGVPGVTAPPGATPQQVAQAAQLASSMRAGDSSGMGLPAGFTAQLMGLTGSVPDALAFIQYMDQQMARSCLAGFLDLGQSSHGSHALGTSLVDLLMLSEQAIADHMAEVITRDLVADIVGLNFGEDVPAPVVEVGDVGSRHVVTAEAINMLITCGALQPDPALEAFLRKEWSLPSNSLPWVKPPAPVEPALKPPVAATRAGSAHRAALSARAATGARRDLTTIEAASGVDPEQVDGDYTDALDALVALWLTQVTVKQRTMLGDQVKAALEAGDLVALTKLQADVPGAAGILADAMATIAEQGATEAHDEAAKQGVTTPVPAVDGSRLADAAALFAALAAGSIASSAARKATAAATPGADPQAVADAVETFLEGLTDAALRDILGGAMSLAQNTGRIAFMDAAPQAEYYASEILDQATCDPCAAIDGHKFDNLDDAETTYANGGYADCDGGLRCRGIIVAVYTDTADTQPAEQAA